MCNSRFLILPWLKVKNLACPVMGMVFKRIPGDWEDEYGTRSILVETFVDRDRFEGTCYKASNWVFLGLVSSG